LEYLSPAALSACLEEEGALSVCANAVQRLLEVIRNFVTAWSASAETHLAQSQSLIDAFTVSTGTASVRASALEACMRLYYEPRVVRVQPRELLLRLRRVAWALSAQPVLLQLLSSSSSSTAAVAAQLNAPQQVQVQQQAAALVYVFGSIVLPFYLVL
jgi:hypothetical protein